jgi:hypothetical protein
MVPRGRLAGKKLQALEISYWYALCLNSQIFFNQSTCHDNCADTRMLIRKQDPRDSTAKQSGATVTYDIVMDGDEMKIQYVVIMTEDAKPREAPAVSFSFFVPPLPLGTALLSSP